MTSQEVEDLLNRYINDRCTTEERHFVEKSFDAMGRGQDDLDPDIREAMQKRLWTKLTEEVAKEPSYARRDRYLKIGRVAAVLLVLIASVSLINLVLNSRNNAGGIANRSSKMIEFVNSSKFTKHINLNDGSTIELYPNGTITFPETFGDVREVYLVGEAFFEVAKDPAHPFFVYANEVTTKVLGTSFLIKAYKQAKEITVSVKTGKVSVYTNDSKIKTSTNFGSQQKAVILTPNQQAIYNRSEGDVLLTIADDPQVIHNQPSPITNYTNVPVIQILETLEESYGIDIQYDKDRLSNCTITSDMLDEGLYEQVEIICNAIGAHYTISGPSIVVETNGCK